MILFRVAGWLSGGSYSDIKTNLSQVGLNWDLPTGLSLAITVFINHDRFYQCKPWIFNLTSRTKGQDRIRSLYIISEQIFMEEFEF